jgi:hypothetical protein
MLKKLPLKKLLLLLISATFSFNAYSQDIPKIETDYIYVVESLEDIEKLEVETEIQFTGNGVYSITSGEGGSYLLDTKCITNSDLEEETEGRTERFSFKCLSGGKVIYTSRPGQVKVAFVNISGEEEGEDFFSSGIIYANFETESPSELLFW